MHAFPADHHSVKQSFCCRNLLGIELARFSDQRQRIPARGIVEQHKIGFPDYDSQINISCSSLIDHFATAGPA
jgi:hypothetical protein